jgi:hypothetical protein
MLSGLTPCAPRTAEARRDMLAFGCHSVRLLPPGKELLPGQSFAKRMEIGRDGNGDLI